MMRSIRIATRKSPLALWQAEYVAALITRQLNCSSELILLSTEGDDIQHRPLADFGGKGLFIKRLEEALLQDQADIAVHSMKDVPAILDHGFEIAAIFNRASVLDVLITVEPLTSFQALKEGAIIGTSSYRRQAQLKAYRPDLHCVPLRGNIGTRLKKIKSEGLDGIVLAEAGLERLNIQVPHRIRLPFELCLPGGGQGALGIECRSDQVEIRELMGLLNDAETSFAVRAERAFIATLEGDCRSPIACYATIQGDQLKLQGRILSPEGDRCLDGILEGASVDCETIGIALARSFLDGGARKILDLCHASHSHL